jgi:hypothetical protein
VALPHRKQQLQKFIPFHDLTIEQVALALGCNSIRVKNLCQGHIYPTPAECDALERLFGLPVEVLLEARLIAYRYDWPPPRGMAAAVENELRRRGGESSVDQADA